MIYLIIFSDFKIFKTNVLTPTDYELADDGVYEIIRVQLRDNVMYSHQYLDGKWVDIEKVE